MAVNNPWGQLDAWGFLDTWWVPRDGRGEARKGTRVAADARKGTRVAADARKGTSQAPITYAMLTYGDDDYAEGQTVYTIGKGSR